MSIEIYIARHATPDWSRKDLRYDVLPGPPLTPLGESEAQQLGRFLRARSVSHIYTSPFERAHRTAELAAEVIGMPLTEDGAIREWAEGETPTEVSSRILPFWKQICIKAAQQGPICLVTHGGPMKLILTTLGMTRAKMETYTVQFDANNPAPPAGTWLAKSGDGDTPWSLEMVFSPRAEQTSAD